MGPKMTFSVREQLIQRYYDGETIGRESELVEEMLRTEPEAQQILERLVMLSDNIKIDLGAAVAEEDFSQYWDNIQSRLPAGPLSGEVSTVADAAGPAPVVMRKGRRMTPPQRPWLAWVLGPALGAAAAALIMALFVVPASRSPEPVPLAEVAAPDHTIEIESIESDGPLVMVMQENSEQPAIIWFVETDVETEG